MGGRGPGKLSHIIYATKAFLGYSVEKLTVVKSYFHSSSVQRKPMQEASKNISERHVLSAAVGNKVGKRAETASGTSHPETAPSAVNVWDSQYVSFGKMTLAECESHLQFIQHIENTMLEEIKKPNQGGAQEERELSVDATNEIEERLETWQNLPPKGLDIPVRDKLNELLQQTGENEGLSLYALRKIFPIRESGSFQVVDGRRKAVSEYKGAVSSQVSSVADALRDAQS